MINIYLSHKKIYMEILPYEIINYIFSFILHYHKVYYKFNNRNVLYHHRSIYLNKLTKLKGNYDNITIVLNTYNRTISLIKSLFSNLAYIQDIYYTYNVTYLFIGNAELIHNIPKTSNIKKLFLSKSKVTSIPDGCNISNITILNNIIPFIKLPENYNGESIVIGRYNKVSIIPTSFHSKLLCLGYGNTIDTISNKNDVCILQLDNYKNLNIFNTLNLKKIEFNLIDDINKNNVFEKIFNSKIIETIIYSNHIIEIDSFPLYIDKTIKIVKIPNIYLKKLYGFEIKTFRILMGNEHNKSCNERDTIYNRLDYLEIYDIKEIKNCSIIYHKL